MHYQQQLQNQEGRAQAALAWHLSQKRTPQGPGQRRGLGSLFLWVGLLLAIIFVGSLIAQLAHAILHFN